MFYIFFLKNLELPSQIYDILSKIILLFHILHKQN